MFKIGEKIMYPLHGAGTIEEIQIRVLGNTGKEYYVINLLATGMKITLPVENSTDLGLRPVIDENEAKQLLDEFSELECEYDPNWSKRCRENMALLKSGDIHNSARVYKSLCERNSSKILSAGERKIMLTAKQMIISEFVYALGVNKQKAEDLLNKAVS